MKRSPLPLPLLGLFGFFAASASAQEAPPTPPTPPPSSGAKAAPAEGSYVRFVHAGASAGNAAPAAPDRLQTAIAGFERGGERVDLVGVVHLADAAYYDELQRRLAGYDAVLYEMVGGPATAPQPETAPSEGVGAIRQFQQLAKGFLGLEFQLDGIDYSAPNFVHADVAWDEMDALMAARSQSFATLFTRAMSLAERGGLAGLPSDEAAMQAMAGRLFSAALSGNSAELKRSLAPFLSQAESLVVQIEGEDGTVLVGERNRVAMEKLAELRSRRPSGSYAILYGAGHMPDFEQRLLAAGFRKGATVWLDAWSIPAPGSPEAAPTGPAPLETLLRTLTEDPEVRRGLQELGTTLEQLGGAMKSLAPTEP